MPKYIDAEKLTELCKKVDGSKCSNNFFGPDVYDFLYHLFIPKVLEETPSIDAVEVVRCKDCKLYHTQKCAMDDWHFAETKEDNFCSFAERRIAE